MLTRVVAYGRDRLFRVVSGIEHYPDFVPGYRKVVVRRRTPDRLYVTQTVSVLGWDVTFDSVAEMAPPRSLVITATAPGFRTMRIEWRFEAPAPRRTRISVTIDYEAGNALARRFSGPWIRAFAGMQVKAFLERMETPDCEA